MQVLNGKFLLRIGSERLGHEYRVAESYLALCEKKAKTAMRKKRKTWQLNPPRMHGDTEENKGNLKTLTTEATEEN